MYALLAGSSRYVVSKRTYVNLVLAFCGRVNASTELNLLLMLVYQYYCGKIRGKRYQANRILCRVYDRRWVLPQSTYRDNNAGKRLPHGKRPEVLSSAKTNQRRGKRPPPQKAKELKTPRAHGKRPTPLNLLG